MRRTAFTLIELLVVVAIITALIAILLPSMNKSMGLAKGAACASNLRQLETALLAYGAGNKMRSLGYYDWNLWQIPLNPYHSEAASLRDCPEVKDRATEQIWGRAYWGSNQMAWGILKADSSSIDYSSYAMNGFMYHGGTPGNPGGRYHVSGAVGAAYPQPWAPSVAPPFASKFPVFFDGAWVDTWPQHTDPISTVFTGQRGTFSGMMGRAMLDRHEMAINMVFADGHAERVPLSMMYDQQWSLAFERQGEISLP